MAAVTELSVLHVLRLVGVVETTVVAGRLGADPVVVDAALESFALDALVQRSTGSLVGWSLTAVGRRRGEELLAEELGRAGATAIAESTYESFLPLNAEVLRVCSDWQVRPSPSGELVLNDHSDTGHDRAVLSRLGSLHVEAEVLLAPLGAALERFAGYPSRLGTALGRARAGRREWVTKPVIDSYHTVWFELHEDLLATLRRSRAAERENDEGNSSSTTGDEPTTPPASPPSGSRDEAPT